MSALVPPGIVASKLPSPCFCGSSLGYLDTRTGNHFCRACGRATLDAEARQRAERERAEAEAEQRTETQQAEPPASLFAERQATEHGHDPDNHGKAQRPARCWRCGSRATDLDASLSPVCGDHVALVVEKESGSKA